MNIYPNGVFEIFGIFGDTAMGCLGVSQRDVWGCRNGVVADVSGVYGGSVYPKGVFVTIYDYHYITM
jgi:hypothetical protein